MQGTFKEILDKSVGNVKLVFSFDYETEARYVDDLDDLRLIQEMEEYGKITNVEVKVIQGGNKKGA